MSHQQTRHYTSKVPYASDRRRDAKVYNREAGAYLLTYNHIMHILTVFIQIEVVLK